MIQAACSQLPADNEYYGIAVDLWGNYVVVGEEYHNHWPSSGTARIYARPDAVSPWGFQASLLPSTGSAFDTFGNAVAIAGSEVIISAGHDLLCGNRNCVPVLAFAWHVRLVWKRSN
ncbi:MAG: FG-GAP repeat protein [Planctomycetota bacterium]